MICVYITGLAETISFNVSSIVPPSPIMAALMRNTELNAAQPNVVNGGHQMGKRPRSTSETSTQITMDLDKYVSTYVCSIHSDNNILFGKHPYALCPHIQFVHLKIYEIW